MTGTTETTQEVCPKCGTAGCLEDKAIDFAYPAEAETRKAAAPLPAAALPPPVTDFGPVRLELMGHRYREGRLSETVIAGVPFLRLDLEGGAAEYYRPDAVYCISPATAPVPRAEIPARFDYALDDADDEDEGYLDDDD